MKRKSITKLITTALAICLIGGLLGACGKKEKPASETTKVEETAKKKAKKKPEEFQVRTGIDELYDVRYYTGNDDEPYKYIFDIDNYVVAEQSENRPSLETAFPNVDPTYIKNRTFDDSKVDYSTPGKYHASVTYELYQDPFEALLEKDDTVMDGNAAASIEGMFWEDLRQIAKNGIITITFEDDIRVDVKNHEDFVLSTMDSTFPSPGGLKADGTFGKYEY